MNYKKIYNDFIADRRTKEAALVASGEYFEKHHIVPRSLGGSNDKENLICLTAGDHFFAHLCLAMRYKGKQWSGVEAMVNMRGSSKKREIIARRRWVDVARREAAKTHSERSANMHKNGQLRNCWSEEANRKRGEAVKQQRFYNNGLIEIRLKESDVIPDGFVRGRKKIENYNLSEEGLARIRAAAKLRDHNGNKNAFYGKMHSTESKAKISEANSVKVINLDTGEIFPSLASVWNLTKLRGTKRCNLSIAIRENRPAGGYRWAYHKEQAA